MAYFIVHVYNCEFCMPELKIFLIFQYTLYRSVKSLTMFTHNLAISSLVFLSELQQVAFGLHMQCDLIEHVLLNPMLHSTFTGF